MAELSTNRMAAVAGLLGDPARAAMLATLMDGRALTAGELAAVASIAPPTASGHLARLTEAGLIAVERQGRHRYHRLASPDVARLLETVMQIAAATCEAPTRRPAVGPRDGALRRARLCYDHLAGEIGVGLADSLLRRGAIQFDDGTGVVTEAGVAFLADLGIAPDQPATPSRRPLCRPCLDWSERRPHVAGRLGAALCRHFLDHGYVRRVAGSRALTVTQAGRAALRDVFDLPGF